MGYDFHITRADHWIDSGQKPITADEWLALVEKDQSLIIDPRENGPCFALWVEHRVNHDFPWFNWSGGEVYANRPDRKTLGKMVQLAKQLAAHVQGDEGEVYLQAEDLPEK